MSEVDVLIVTYGGANDLPECIRAVRSQGDAIGRVLVIDNASPDDTLTAARDLTGVEVVANTDNRGYATAMNQGLRLSSAEFVLSLNADCVMEPGYVGACVAALDEDPHAAAATGLLVLPDGRVDSTGFTLSSAGWAQERGRHCDPAETAGLGAPFGVSGAAALWRRSALDELGPDPWWEWLFVYWDDVELCWRAQRRGWRFAFVSAARATHRRGADTAPTVFVESQSFRNRLATLARHRGWLGLLSPAPLAVTSVVALRLALRHPAALRAAHPIVAARAGLAARRNDAALDRDDLCLPRHPWRAWMGGQLGHRQGRRP